MSSRSPKTSGTRADRRVRGPLGVLAAVLLFGTVSGCMYTFEAGAGLPDHAEVMAVQPFDNETGRFEITQEVQDALMEDLPPAFGIVSGGEDVADVLVRGTIRSYDVQSAIHQPGEQRGQAQVLERQVRLSVAVEVIDLERGVILWENSNLSVDGEFAVDTGTEEQGRAEAIERMVERIVDGIQAQW